VTVRVLRGHVLDVLAELPAKSVHVCVTSPPYWGLRAYGTPPQVWGGAGDGCDHVWGDPITGQKRGQDAGDTARVGNTQKRVCPPITQQGAFCVRCGAWRGELGSEPTLDLFVAHLVEVFAAVGRVLRDDGTLWVNLGDSYAGGGQGGNGGMDERLGHTRPKAEGTVYPRSANDGSLKPGDLCLAPARFALAMQAAGWRLRSEITLCKTAPMPESVTGSSWQRCRVKVAEGTAPGGFTLGRADRQATPTEAAAHFDHRKPPGSEWADCPGCPKCAATDGLVQRWGSGRPTSAKESLFIFAKGTGAYYYDVEAVRVAPTQGTLDRLKSGPITGPGNGPKGRSDADDGRRADRGWETYAAPSGRNLWNYVMWAPEPLQAAHYAAYPRWLPRLAIQAGTSERGCCPACGAPWLRVVSRGTVSAPGKQGPSTYEGMNRENDRWPSGTPVNSGLQRDEWNTGTTVGWRQSCRCPAHEPAPCTVLDIFSGSGTTVIEANALGRHGIGIELQERYVAITHQRLAGQPLSLFAWEAAAVAPVVDTEATMEAGAAVLDEAAG
jgi:DNA modification methylase